MNIDIKGHSGCDINIITYNKHLCVKKESTNKSYLNRLYQQGMKQQDDAQFQNIVKVPLIHENIISENNAYIIMDYIYANNFIDFFECASKSDIYFVLDTILKYLNNEISVSTVQPISKDVFVNKINSVINNCSKNTLLQNEKTYKLLDKLSDVFNNIEDTLYMPVGKCHGDLTFSNILFTSNNLYFIDYLDSFIETPLQDIVKLRQDTKYLWSTQMYNGKYDKIRLKIIFDFIDNVLYHYLEDINDFPTNTIYMYNVLQLMNFARILPYVKKESVRDFVINTLNELLYEV